MRILKGEAVFDLYRYAYLLPSCAGTEERPVPLYRYKAISDEFCTAQTSLPLNNAKNVSP